MFKKEQFTELRFFLKKNRKIQYGEFYKMVGISPSAYNQIESGVNKPGVERIIGIAKAFPDLNLRWLILAEGPMWSSEEGKVVSKTECQEEIEKLEKEVKDSRLETIRAQKKAIELQDRVIELLDEIKELKK